MLHVCKKGDLKGLKNSLKNMELHYSTVNSHLNNAVPDTELCDDELTAKLSCLQGHPMSWFVSVRWIPPQEQDLR